MLAPKSWLTDFVDLNGISDEQFAREMTFAGNKVESVQKINGEVVYEFEITSNRPDALSMIGLAREASAVFDRKLRLPLPMKKKNLKQSPIKLIVENKTICPVFSVVELDHIKVKPSSTVISKRLEASGIRPINNVVDITNYVMLETGQPMHAFDADTLRGPLFMRTAKQNEQIITIDHKKRTFSDVECVIEDRERLVHLAGLMGEVHSEISDKTTHIALHVPVYDPIFVRRSSKHLRLRTEGSTRFEKKLDLTQTESAAVRAIELLEKETGGKQTTAIVTTRSFVNFQQPIVLSTEKVSSLVGLSFTKEEIEKYLATVGIRPVRPMTFMPPSWRRDITIPVDLVEEVTRLYGYNKFPRTLPVGQIPINADSLEPNWKRIVAERCVALGYTETYASTLVGKKLIEELELYSPEQHLRVLHPMSEDFEYMRRTILETLTPFLKQNLVETNTISIFELGTVFTPTTKSSVLPDQPLELGLISTTNSYSEFKGHIESIGKSLGVQFQFISGHCEKFLESERSRSRRSSTRQSHENRSPHPAIAGFAMTDIVSVCLAGSRVGQIGQISSAYAGYLHMTAIFQSATKAFQYPQLSGYPPIIEDFTLKRPAGKYLVEALSVIKNISALVRNVEYLGEYQHFVTLRVTYQSFNRSLTQEEVGAIRKDLLKKLESLGWRLKA